MLNSAEHEICLANKSQLTHNSQFFLAKYSWAWKCLCNKYENSNYCWHFLAFSYLLAEIISCSAEYSMKRFIIHRYYGHWIRFVVFSRHFYKTQCFYNIFAQQAQTITKTRLFKYIENFTTKKKGKFSDKKFWYFSYFCSKQIVGTR